MLTKSTKTYRHCPKEDYEISIFICRGRQKAHYPKCPECEFRTTTEEIPPVPAKKVKKKPQPPATQPKTGSIMVKSVPPSAEIFLDDENIGVTPAIITQVFPGRYKIKIKMDEYNVWSQSVDVKANRETSLTAVLQGRDCSVVIESKPTKAEVYIDGNNVGVTPVTIDSVKPGKYLVEVKRDGYEVWSEKIDAEIKKKTFISAELKTKYGAISLNSEPDKANILLDGIEVGVTPVSLRSVLHGDHKVEIRLDGYSVWEKSVSVEPARETVLTAKLQVNTGSVSVKSKPENAKVFLDGKPVGTTPESITSINPGIHEIKVEMEKYDVWTDTVNIEAGKEDVINAVLQRSTGSLMVESNPPNAIIFVDGKEIGHTPEIIMSSAKGTHTIEVRMDGYDIWKKTLDIEPGEEKSVTAVLQIKSGTLIINSKPSGGTIFLDGEAKGTTPENLKGLKTGTHQIEVKMDGYEAWSESVEISADKENKLIAELQILTGALSVKSEPSNAKISIDGKGAGNTPTNLPAIIPGKHLVEVKMDGYEVWSERIDVSSSKENLINAVLLKLVGSINIKSEPTNAIVIVGGKEVGNTPLDINDLKPGKHLVEVKMDGYGAWSESVEISADKENKLTAELQILTGALSVKSEPSNAKISIDGKGTGNTPANISAIIPGKHLVEVKMDGYEVWNESIDVSSSKENLINAVLQKLVASVNIKSEPTNAIVIVGGKEIGNTPLDINDLKPGKYHVKVKMERYKDWSENVVINAGKDNNLTVVLQQLVGSVKIKSEPANATIMIDGKEAGNTPAVINDIKPGKHLVEVKMDDYETWSNDVTVEIGKDVDLTAILQLKPGTLTLISEPTDATVYIDDQKIGNTPLTIDAPDPGKHSIETRMDGYETWSRSIDFVHGKSITLTATLQINPGTVSITSEPSNAIILIDSNEVGKTPFAITDHAPGTHTVELRMDGYDTWTKSVDFEQGIEIAITAELQIKAGSISISSNPPEAFISIDSKKSGKTPVTITDLSPGTHLVEVRLDGYEEWSESVDIIGDKENTITAELLAITASINIDSNPSEAAIYLDGEKVGTTPDVLKSVAIGTHEVGVKLEGFAEWKRVLNVKNGKEINLNAALQINTGTANIDSDPADAVTLLDGNDVGMTPVSLTDIKIGTYDVELQKEGYVSFKKTIRIKAGKVNSLTTKLVEMTGSVKVDSKPSDAVVVINGKKIGNTPTIISDLAAGKYQLEVMMDCYETWSDSVNIDPGKESTVTAELQTKAASININSEPSNATILIDNKEVGTTPKIVADLSYEEHLVEVRMEGYEAWSDSFNMEPGIELNVVAELQMIAGSVSIDSEPSNAMILIDSNKAGVTPKTLTGILPGEHKIEIIIDGYETWNESVEIIGDKENSITAVLHAITGSINIESNPSDATILLDGKEVGTTPDTITHAAIGIHEIEVKKEGHAEWKKKLNIKKGKEIALNAALQPVTGSASIESEPTGAVIAIDGEDVGKTPKVITGISPGRHEVEIRLEGYDPCVQILKIKNGKESLFSASLQRKKGSLMLISKPENALIHLEGKKQGRTPHTINELAPGNYTIELSLNDYQTWSERRDIVSGEEITITAELQEKPGSISIKSKPTDAKIFIDGKEAGTTPETINDIDCGTRIVKLKMEGYCEWSEKVEVLSNKNSSLNAVLKEMAGSVCIKSNPSEATIHVDGKEVGTTPAIVVDLGPGKHMIKISMEGYNDWSQSVEIDAKEQSELNATLQEITGSLTLKSKPADALIFIDGKKAGTTGETISDIKIGMHQVEIRLDGYESWSENIEITDKEYNLTATLQQKTGSIDINSEPFNATILIDGNKTGSTPETIKNLKPGVHQVEVRADGFDNWSDSVEVTAESKSVVTAILQKASGSINIKSTPEGAKIYINDNEVGITPTVLSSIPIGAHDIVVQSVGHECWKKSIIVKKEKELSLNAVLQVNIGSINIESHPENAKVFIDGKEIGKAPNRFTDINVGVHEIEVVLDGYVTWEKTIKVKPEKETSLSADLKEISGAVGIETEETTKAPVIEKPIIDKTSELKTKPEKVKEKPITPPKKSKPSSAKDKTKHSPDKLIKLRWVPEKISGSQIESLPYITINEKNNNIYFCHSSINHNYELKPIGDGDVVIDHTTELMWHQAGSSEYFNLKKANKWLKTINKKGYAGFDDWRLPTLEEASSLLEFGTKSGKFIDSIFDEKQWGTWTDDKSDKGHAWIVTYVNGTISEVQAGTPATFVRPVRSANI